MITFLGIILLASLIFGGLNSYWAYQANKEKRIAQINAEREAEQERMAQEVRAKIDWLGQDWVLWSGK